jgi:hypothetical protein
MERVNWEMRQVGVRTKLLVNKPLIKEWGEQTREIAVELRRGVWDKWTYMNELGGQRIHVDDEKLLDEWVGGWVSDWVGQSPSEPSLRSHSHRVFKIKIRYSVSRTENSVEGRKQDANAIAPISWAVGFVHTSGTHTAYINSTHSINSNVFSKVRLQATESRQVLSFTLS